MKYELVDAIFDGVRDSYLPYRKMPAITLTAYRVATRHARVPSNPRATTTPSRWIMPKARMARQRAGTRFPNGIGNAKITERMRQATPTRRSLSARASHRGWDKRSSLLKTGATYFSSFWTKDVETDRSRIFLGIPRLSPNNIRCPEMTMSGIAKIVDMLGRGIGRVSGRANSRSPSPCAREPPCRMTSPKVIFSSLR
jgi:hypothetical protein